MTHLLKMDSTSSNTIKIDYLKKAQHQLNKHYKSLVSELSCLFEKYKFTENLINK